MTSTPTWTTGSTPGDNGPRNFHVSRPLAPGEKIDPLSPDAGGDRIYYRSRDGVVVKYGFTGAEARAAWLNSRDDH